MSTILTAAAGYQNFVPQNIDDVRKAITEVIPPARGTRVSKTLPFIAATMDDLQRAIDNANTKGNVEMGKALSNLKLAYQSGNPRLEFDGEAGLTALVYGNQLWFQQGSHSQDELGIFARTAGSQLNGLNEKLDITDFGVNVGVINTSTSTTSQTSLPSYPTLPSYPSLPTAQTCSPGIPTPATSYCPTSSTPNNNFGYNNNNAALPWSLNIINNFGSVSLQQGFGRLLQGLFNRRYF